MKEHPILDLFENGTITIIVMLFLIGLLIGFSLHACESEKQTMFCPECGKRYHDGNSYCDQDGHELKEVNND